MLYTEELMTERDEDIRKQLVSNFMVEMAIYMEDKGNPNEVWSALHAIADFFLERLHSPEVAYSYLNVYFGTIGFFDLVAYPTHGLSEQRTYNVLKNRLIAKADMVGVE